MRTVAAAATPDTLHDAVARGARWVALSPGTPVDGRALARRHGIFLLTADEPARPARASTPPPPAAVLWSPDGRVVARQRSVLAGAADLALFDVGGWPCGILAGEDARSPELARVMQLRGALCLWCLPPSPEGGEWGQLAGVWSLVQQTQCFAVEAAVPPWRPAVHAPCELTPGRTGFLARGGPPALAELDAAALAELRRSYDLRRHLNPAFYRRHMPHIYEGPS